MTEWFCSNVSDFANVKTSSITASSLTATQQHTQHSNTSAAPQQHSSATAPNTQESSSLTAALKTTQQQISI
jgi:hypothetical protein